MKHILDYHKYNINEKLKFSDILLSLFIFYTGFKIHKDYKTLDKLYTTINSSTSNPTYEESNTLELARQSMIEEISKSSKFNKFGKEELLDSLSNIKFKVVDSLEYVDKIAGGSIACFIDLKYMKNTKKIGSFLEVPKENDIIIIRRDILYSEDVEDISYVLTHELYHYLDKLSKISKEISGFVDEKVKTDKEYAANKFALLSRNDIYISNNSEIKKLKFKNNKGESVSTYQIAKIVIDNYIYKFDYYSSSEEIYVRWMTLKVDMAKLGVIDNIDEKIDLSDISEYLDKCDEINISHCHDIMMVLDWEKLEEFQKIF